MSRKIWRVGELIREVNELLSEGFAGIWVEGEVTNAVSSGRGHLYFTLKDASSALDCVMWASRARSLKFKVEDGLALTAFGSLTIYPQRGRFQLVVEQLEPQGVGALQLAFEQLKAKLAAEGLFAPERKRPLPALPQRVGIVTSATGAAVRDMLMILRRLPHVRVVLAPAMVQGDGAADQIARGIERLGASGLVDVVIVGRGGGSLEDLWAFNEEAVARAIAACPVPVISGVGHEVDFTIADFVADIRAATPTHAAEIVASKIEEQAGRLDDAGRRMGRAFARHVALARARLAGLEGSSGLARVPQRIRLAQERLGAARRLPGLVTRMVERARMRLHAADAAIRRTPARLAAGTQRQLLDSRIRALRTSLGRRMERADARLKDSERALGHLNPRAILERGYSITAIEGSTTPLKDPARVRHGTHLVTTLAAGLLRSVAIRGGRTRARQAPAVTDQPGLFDDEERT
ncbi:MAG: exodeoxyribonuclease VII large subunit [Acidobacteria bacterium]|nr:exodeoxyribonuclease VII large subunit [Acidobacteriota bacterium]